MRFTFSIRKKGILDFPLMDTLNDIFPIRYGKNRLPKSCSILTATNSRMFIGFQFFCFSIARAYDVDVYCYNVGMTQEQLDWCEQVPRLKILNYETEDWMQKVYWQAWAKPFYVRKCPIGEKVLWIDADTVVFGDLNEIINSSKDKPLFTEDFSHLKRDTLNSNRVYSILPIKDVDKDAPPYLNTGVFLLDKKRDKEFLDWWCYAVDNALSNEELSVCMSCWDQGACKWALQRLNMLDCIIPNINFNFPDFNRQILYPPRPKALEYFFSSMRRGAFEKAIVNHWMGSPKPWERWGEMLPIVV